MRKKSNYAKKRERREFLWGWGFILPTMLGLCILNIYPIISTIQKSFYKVGDFGKGSTFVGLDNYIKVFGDSQVWQALFNTLKYVVMQVPLSIFLSLITAVLLNQKIKGKSIYRGIFFLPMVTAPAAIAMIWRWIFNSQYGLINNLLHLDVRWITSPNLTLVTIAIIGIWSVVGYNMVLFLAGLQEIPRDYYEAADIDGASEIRKLFSITVPLISPTMFFISVTSLIGSMQVFDLIFMIVSKGNPALEKTQSLVYLFYKYTFMEKNISYGSTIVVVLLLVILLITALQMLIQKKWVHYE